VAFFYSQSYSHQFDQSNNYRNNVKTREALADCSVDKCKEVLDSGGNHFKMHNPGTWAKQSRMAAEGKWQELIDWQAKLDGGK